MLKVVDGLATQPLVIAACKAAEIAVETWRAITRNDVLDADYATGRGLRTSQTVAAARVNRTERTVRRARALSVRLGVLVELYRGRELSGDERLALVADSPGHRQRGLPNVYAVTVCPPRQRHRISTPRPGRFAQVNRSVHLPPGGGLTFATHLGEITRSAAADAAEDQEPPSAAPPRRRRRRPGLTLAHEVLAHPGLHPLFADVRPGTITAQLAPYRTGGWHGLQLAGALVVEAGRRGISTGFPAVNPWALLKALLAGVDPDAHVHLHVGLTADSTRDTSAAAQPCGRPNCDGHGWVTLAENLVAKCRHCPPAVRRAHPEPVQDPSSGGDEPPF